MLPCHLIPWQPCAPYAWRVGPFSVPSTGVRLAGVYDMLAWGGGAGAVDRQHLCFARWYVGNQSMIQVLGCCISCDMLCAMHQYCFLTMGLLPCHPFRNLQLRQPSRGVVSWLQWCCGLLSACYRSRVVPVCDKSAQPAAHFWLVEVARASCMHACQQS